MRTGRSGGDEVGVAEAVQHARQPRIHVFLSTSDIHRKYMLNATEDEKRRRDDEDKKRAESDKRRYEAFLEVMADHGVDPNAERREVAVDLREAVAIGAPQPAVLVRDRLAEEGGEREDDLLRFLRHFHDPLKPWDTAGFDFEHGEHPGVGGHHVAERKGYRYENDRWVRHDNNKWTMQRGGWSRDSDGDGTPDRSDNAPNNPRRQ